MKNKNKYYHSFVIPTAGRSQYLESCIKSLKNQNVKSKIMITTSKPYKGLHQVAKKFNIKLFVFKKHNNIANDWNRAIRMSTSKFVTIAHQDDIYDKNYTQEIYKSLKKVKKEPSIIFTDYFELKNNIKFISYKIIIKKIILSIFYLRKNLLKKKKMKRRLVLFGSPIPCPTVTFNTDYNIKFDERFWVNIDWALWVKLSNLSGSFLYIKKKLVYHRIHQKSETSKAINDGKRAKEDKILFQKLWPASVGLFLSKIYKLSYKFI